MSNVPIQRLPSLPYNPDVESLTNYSSPPPPSPLKTPMPSLDARPSEVRDYLAQLLVSVRGVEDSKAQNIIAGWQIGSGVELRRYGPKMYRVVFGDQWGWILYWEVALKKHAETPWVWRYPLHSATIFTFALSVTTISLIATLEMSEGVTISLIFSAIFGVIGFLVCSILQCCGIGNSEKKTTERQLRASYGVDRVAAATATVEGVADRKEQ